MVAILVDRLLAVPCEATILAELTELLAAERETLGIRAGELLIDREQAEPLLRILAHVTLSLPEAQLH